MSEMKHVGYDSSTKRKYVVVFRQLPDDKNSALVVETETLLDRYHDSLMSAVESSEAQATDDLYEVLNRKMFFDGENILQTLHAKKYLKKVATESVHLSPSPGSTISLSEHNERLGEVEIPDEDTSDRPSEQGDRKLSAEEEKTGQARNLIIQAQLLEEDARKKRAEAEKMVPGINDETKRPRGRPKKDAPVSPLLNSNEGTENAKIQGR